MEKVRAWCGQPSDQGRLKNRTELLRGRRGAERKGRDGERRKGERPPKYFGVERRVVAGRLQRTLVRVASVTL